jgi:hypothetical protein
MFTMKRQRETVRSRSHLRGAVTLTSLALVATLGIADAAAATSGVERGQSSVRASTVYAGDAGAARGAVPASVSDAIARANTALDHAIARVGANKPGKAIRALGTVREQVSIANHAARAQIGRPPTDPESDDPPGPPSVLGVLRLEHRVGTEVVGMFDGSRLKLVDALRLTLTVTHHRRDATLDAVIALRPEGDGADYADGMADTLGTYTQEVQQLTSAIGSFTLTPEGRDGLTNALTRVRATKAKVDAAFGGGEKLA